MEIIGFPISLLSFLFLLVSALPPPYDDASPCNCSAAAGDEPGETGCPCPPAVLGHRAPEGDGAAGRHCATASCLMFRTRRRRRKRHTRCSSRGARRRTAAARAAEGRAGGATVGRRAPRGDGQAGCRRDVAM
ncbi:hypothetical protein B0H17DRAFT_1174741, partial [Mycena rosella]